MHPKERFARLLARRSRVLDIGAWDGSFQSFCVTRGVSELEHLGVDLERPSIERLPPGYLFVQADVDRFRMPFSAASFDGLVLSHVIEHMSRPLQLVDEAFRVLRHGGLLYIESPSDRSLWLPSMPFRFEENRSLNFFDDPTHVGRPHTPQSLYRLFRMYGADVIWTGYIVSRAVRLRFPWLILRALLQRDAALLEHAVWNGIGFAVSGAARKRDQEKRSYLLPA